MKLLNSVSLFFNLLLRFRIQRFIHLYGMWRVWVRRRECIGSCWGNSEGRRPLGRPRRRCVDNITMDLQEVGCGYMDWIGLAQDRDWRTIVSAVMNLRVPWNAGNFLTSSKPVSFSRRTLHHGVSKYTFICYEYVNLEFGLGKATCIHVPSRIQTLNHGVVLQLLEII